MEYDIEKNQQSSIQMVRKMEQFYDAGDLEHALETADCILAAKPRNRTALERIASLYVDNNRLEQAKDAVGFLLKEFSVTTYSLFLQSRIAYMERDYERVVRIGEQALRDTAAASWLRALLHNIVGRTYRRMGEARKASLHDLEASKFPDSPSRLSDYSNYLFSMHYWNKSREEIFEASCKYNNFFFGYCTI